MPRGLVVTPRRDFAELEKAPGADSRWLERASEGAGRHYLLSRLDGSGGRRGDDLLDIIAIDELEILLIGTEEQSAIAAD